MTETGDNSVERLVKSTERVRDLGEVFTPAGTVQAMLDLLPAEMWEPHPSPTFLEPACGDGNFLVAILQRKLTRLSDHAGIRTLPAGTADCAVTFHALEALSSIYAVDISIDNIVGGTPGHELGARDRMLTVFNNWHHHQFGKPLATRSILLASASWIVERNIQVGNMLATDASGQPTGRDRLPLVEYDWHPNDLTVAVTETTLGAVMEASAHVEGAFAFDYTAPAPVWRGPATELRKAPIVATTVFNGEARNGNGRR